MAFVHANGLRTTLSGEGLQACGSQDSGSDAVCTPHPADGPAAVTFLPPAVLSAQLQHAHAVLLQHEEKLNQAQIDIMTLQQRNQRLSNEVHRANRAYYEADHRNHMRELQLTEQALKLTSLNELMKKKDAQLRYLQEALCGAQRSAGDQEGPAGSAQRTAISAQHEVSRLHSELHARGRQLTTTTREAAQLRNALERTCKVLRQKESLLRDIATALQHLQSSSSDPAVQAAAALLHAPAAPKQQQPPRRPPSPSQLPAELF